MKALILAAGKGTRLKTSKPKALVPVMGKPMLDYVLASIKECGIKDINILIGHKKEQVKKHLGNLYKTIVQKELDGTGGALKAALPQLESGGKPRSLSDPGDASKEGGKDADLLVVMNSDTPLISANSIRRMINYVKKFRLDGCCLSSFVDNPSGYGRILRDQNRKFLKILEESELDCADPFREINAGAYVFRISSLKKVIGELEKKPNNEYYLTELFWLFSKKNMKTEAVQLRDLNEAFGVNKIEDIVQLNIYLKNKIIEEHIISGVNIIDPSTTFIEPDVKIGEDTTILPFSVIRQQSVIGKGCEIGPFAHIRGRSRISDGAVIGNFVEINRSKIDQYSKIKHLAYIGDTTMGKNVNIGAGTITANYDGKNKHKTTIHNNASTGSNTVLVAPVELGPASKTGAGAIVKKNTRIKKEEIYIGVPARKLKKKKR